MNKYIIDTSSLIDMKLKYPKDIFPSLWIEIEDLIKKGRLIAPDEVKKEIERVDDELKIWIKNKRKMFVKPDKSQIINIQMVLSDFPFLAKPEKIQPNADPWLISLAIEKNNQQKDELFTDIYIVVTEESKIKKNRIPAVCKFYNIECINLIELFRKENWKF